VGRVVVDGTDEDGTRATKMDEWVEQPLGVMVKLFLLLTFPYISFVRGARTRVLRTAHRRGWRIPFV
jgi:hypothetical protein